MNIEIGDNVALVSAIAVGCVALLAFVYLFNGCITHSDDLHHKARLAEIESRHHLTNLTFEIKVTPRMPE